MEKVVRIKQCDMCGNEITEEYHGDYNNNFSLHAFENKSYSLVIVPPSGAGRNWILCPFCAKCIIASMDKICKTKTKVLA